MSLLFLSFSLSFITSIFLTNLYGQIIVYIFLFVLCVFWALLIYKIRLYKIIIVSILWLLLGFFYSNYNLQKISNKENFLSTYIWKNLEIKWEILWLDWINENYKNYILKISSIWDNKPNQDINILIKTNKKINFSYKDAIKFKWKIDKPEKINSFDYPQYLKIKNIYWISYIYSFEKIESEEINTNLYTKYKIFLEKTRVKLSETISKIYPTETWNLLAGILIWDKTWFDNYLKNSFNKSWLTHIVAVSGFNITIIIIFLSFILRPFPVFLKIPFIIFSIIFFVNIVWDNAPALRAAIMWIITFLAISSGKQLRLFNLLLLVVIIFILINPLVLNHDISFQLSFLSVLWVVYFSPLLGKLVALVFKNNYIKIIFSNLKEALILTLSAIIFTVPIIVVNFGQLSIIAPISNILITFAIPIAMLFGFLSIILYFISPIIWISIWFIAWIFLKYIIIIATFFWNLNYSIISLNLDKFSNIFMISYFLFLVFIMMYFWKRKNPEIQDF